MWHFTVKNLYPQDWKSESKQSHFDITKLCHFQHIHLSLNCLYISLGNGWFTRTFEVCRSKAFITCESEIYPILIRWEKYTNYKSYIQFKIHTHGDTYKEIYKPSGIKTRGGAAYLQVIFCFKCCNKSNFLHVTLNGCVEVPDMIKAVLKKNNSECTLQNTRETVVLI